MTERGADFDAKREAYEAARAELENLIDRPTAHVPVSEYRSALRAAQLKVNRAHKAWLAAWE